MCNLFVSNLCGTFPLNDGTAYKTRTVKPLDLARSCAETSSKARQNNTGLLHLPAELTSLGRESFWPRPWPWIMRLGFKPLCPELKALPNLFNFTLCYLHRESSTPCDLSLPYVPWHLLILVSKFTLLLFSSFAVSMGWVKWPWRLFLTWCPGVPWPFFHWYISMGPPSECQPGCASGKAKGKDVCEIMKSWQFQCSYLLQTLEFCSSLCIFNFIMFSTTDRTVGLIPMLCLVSATRWISLKSSECLIWLV